MSVIYKLDELAEVQSTVKRLVEEKLARIDTVYTEEIKAQIAAINAEYEPQFQYLNDREAMLLAEIKDAVLLIGQSIRGKSLMAVFNKGRVTWDTAKLEGFAEAYPEIKQFRKVGEPSVTIKQINSKENKHDK